VTRCLVDLALPQIAMVNDGLNWCRGHDLRHYRLRHLKEEEVVAAAAEAKAKDNVK